MSTSARTDGRKHDQLRELTIVYEGLDRVDGSARFGFGATHALASVSGPVEIRPTLELPSQATLEIHIRPLASVSATDSKALATTLKAILAPALFLSHHPRTLVQIVGQALCGSGSGSGLGSVGRGWNASLVASLVNASTAALLNASSVPMRGCVCAVAVGRLAGPTLVLDPAEAELALLTASGCFAFLFSAVLSGAAPADAPPCALLWTNYTSSTPFDESELAGARELAEKGAQEVWQTMKESVGWMEKSGVPAGRKNVSKATSRDLVETGGARSEDDMDDARMEI
ncbi:hypothetical protein B0H21DRAFT_38466 [Amylocystis lapponica]|nr:hypothetical protein B0H21DRAFT_38466 [Amylocystis lapponica]